MPDSSQEGTEKSHDVTLFIERALWFSKEQNMTVSRFLDWFSSYLFADDQRFIILVIPFLDPENKTQVVAEEILCGLLGETFQKEKRVRTVNSKITRRIDWPRTYIKAFPLIPREYHQVEIQKSLDIALLGALADIAQGWSNIQHRVIGLLKESEGEDLRIKDLEVRSQKLSDAVSALERQGINPRSMMLNSAHRQSILRHILPSQHNLFQESLTYWGGQAIEAVMEDILKLLNKLAKIEGNSNLDNLFEATSHLCILHAAAGSGWKFNSESRSAPYHLKKGNLNLKLGKGKPKNLFPKSPYAKEDNDSNLTANEVSDRMLGIRGLAGEIKATGYEPDVVMGFYLDGREDSPHVIFGDAKNYKKSDIAGAYKETVSSTMIAFGHWGGLSINASASWEEAFKCDVNPFFTLFYINKTEDKKNGKTPIQTVSKKPSEQRSKDDPNQIPPIIAVELEHMILNEDGRSSELDQWFADIEEQVFEVLLKS